MTFFSKWFGRKPAKRPVTVELIKGHAVAKLNDLTEHYAQTSDKWLSASVSASRIQLVFESFIKRQAEDEQFFMFVELPTSREIEEELDDGFHRDIHYLSGLNQAAALGLLQTTNFQILIHDAMSYVGFGTRFSQSELGLYAYNVMAAHAANGLGELEVLFESLGIPKQDTLRSARDYITKEHYGVASTYAIDGKICYDVVEEWKKLGLYFYERRSE